MRQHNTPEEKQIRREMYIKLREAGKSPHEARVFRDWTDNKIEMVIKGEANPIPKW